MIRPLQYDDLAAIREINAIALGYDFSLEQVEVQYQACSKDAGHFFFVFVEDESKKVVGYVHAQVFHCLYAVSGLNLLALAVLPPFQGKKIGSRLLKHVEEVAATKGLAFIRLHSGQQRDQAHRFYEQNGYESNKLQKRFIKTL